MGTLNNSKFASLGFHAKIVPVCSISLEQRYEVLIDVCTYTFKLDPGVGYLHSISIILKKRLGPCYMWVVFRSKSSE